MSIHISCISLIISVDSIFIFLFRVEFFGSKKAKSSSAEFWMSVDRWWDVNIGRRSSRMSIILLELIVYATRCVIDFFCTLLSCWDCALLHEEIVYSISHLKNVCSVLSGYLQYMSNYFSCVAIWVPENTKFVLC